MDGYTIDLGGVMVNTSSTANEREDRMLVVFAVLTVWLTMGVIYTFIIVRERVEKSSVLKREGERVRNDRAAWDELTDKERDQYFDEFCGEGRR
jgi:hypothetical protein